MAQLILKVTVGEVGGGERWRGTVVESAPTKTKTGDSQTQTLNIKDLNFSVKHQHLYSARSVFIMILTIEKKKKSLLNDIRQ